jgi:hypothetical protein
MPKVSKNNLVNPGGGDQETLARPEVFSAAIEPL